MDTTVLRHIIRTTTTEKKEEKRSCFITLKSTQEGTKRIKEITYSAALFYCIRHGTVTGDADLLGMQLRRVLIKELTS